MDAVDQTIAAGPFKAEWESLKAYQVPAWYEDGKFGIFIHWGVYSVPAFGNEWYPRNMYRQGTPEFQHHVATYGPHAQFGYKDFIPQLTAANFDANSWAELFAKSGAKFVVPVAEHHDGFAMYDTALSEWNAMQMGPKRDILGELAAATRKHDMVFGLSSHRAEHWWFFNAGTQFDSDVRDPRNLGLYGPAQTEPSDLQSLNSAERPDQVFLDDWLARTCELIDKYQPQLIWFDWWIQHEAFEPSLCRFAAYYYNRGAEWGRGVAVNHKYKAFPEGAAVFDIERGQVSDIYPHFWQNDTSVAKNSWGYSKNQDYKTVDSLVDDLVDVVSKNGALLLNVGPRPDGTIPEEEQQMLLEIGEWLALNGEAIYGTRPWKVFGEGPTQVSEGAFTDTKRAPFTGQDIRFTAKGADFYATMLAWPGEQVTIHSLAASAGLW
ncbi:MAG: alpha-L-fucosidase, partial [Roseiflexaceae bacterium]|nr:alpha-L-fucosidase [Roseiflexaceae bacterium]